MLGFGTSSRDKELIAEMRGILESYAQEYAYIALQEFKSGKRKFDKGEFQRIIGIIHYLLTARVKNKYGLTVDHFERLFKKAVMD
ncbi:MAG TPA: hypothetical protein VGG99_11935 [Acetobacteraceae bacterium]|jgi:hypothetical protein